MPAPEASEGVDGATVVWMRKALHDLCQPLTALECGLFLGTMSPDGVRAPRAEELVETILQALEQCELLTGQVRAMQDRLQDGTEPKGD